MIIPTNSVIKTDIRKLAVFTVNQKRYEITGRISHISTTHDDNFAIHVSNAEVLVDGKKASEIGYAWNGNAYTAEDCLLEFLASLTRKDGLCKKRVYPWHAGSVYRRFRCSFRSVQRNGNQQVCSQPYRRKTNAATGNRQVPVLCQRQRRRSGADAPKRYARSSQRQLFRKRRPSGFAQKHWDRRRKCHLPLRTPPISMKTAENQRREK